MLPRLGAMLEYLNAYRLDAMPADAQRLFFLTLSSAEFYRGEPHVPDSFDESRFHGCTPTGRRLRIRNHR